MKKEIFDQLGRLVGYTEKIGTDTHLFDNMGRRLGKYDPLFNEVRDNMGRLVGKGVELLGSLLKK